MNRRSFLGLVAQGAVTIAAPRRPSVPPPPDKHLFVDDAIVTRSTLTRTWHTPVPHPANPILAPTTAWEGIDDENPCAMPYSDGVWWDPVDHVFKLWYMAGYTKATAVAYSDDGVRWTRPRLDVVPGTNLVDRDPRDSSTVWRDGAGWVMASSLGGRLHFKRSTDGVHWHPTGVSGPCGDRTTIFRAPDGSWGFSLRNSDDNRRTRELIQRTTLEGDWVPSQRRPWLEAERMQPPVSRTGERVELYNVDVVPYEGVWLGFFTFWRGEPIDREKLNEIGIGFSRDGQTWVRPPQAVTFIGPSETPGSWNWANVQSVGNGALHVGSQVYVYASGRQGIPGTSLPGRCSTGLYTLRRDGFVSLRGPGTLTTIPLRQGRLFANLSGRWTFTVTSSHHETVLSRLIDVDSIAAKISDVVIPDGSTVTASSNDGDLYALGIDRV